MISDDMIERAQKAIRYLHHAETPWSKEQVSAVLEAALQPDADVAGVVEFLNEAARYFENCPAKGEDRAFWANVYNTENCRKAAVLITRLSAELAEARRAHDATCRVLADTEARATAAEAERDALQRKLDLHREALDEGSEREDDLDKLGEWHRARATAAEAELAEARAEIERMTPKFVAYDYLESPAGREIAEDRATAAEAERNRLREELICALDALIDHNGDDMNDSRANRVAELRAALGEKADG